MSELPISCSDIQEWISKFQRNRDRNQELVNYFNNQLINSEIDYDTCNQYVKNVKLARENLQKEINYYQKEAEKYQRRLDDDIKSLEKLYAEIRKKFSNCRS